MSTTPEIAREIVIDEHAHTITIDGRAIFDGIAISAPQIETDTDGNSVVTVGIQSERIVVKTIYGDAEGGQ